jgi:hypothetical protein
MLHATSHAKVLQPELILSIQAVPVEKNLLKNSFLFNKKRKEKEIEEKGKGNKNKN